MNECYGVNRDTGRKMQRQLDAIVQLIKFKGLLFLEKINQDLILFTHVIHCSSYNVSNNNQHIFVSGTNEKYKTIQKYCCQQIAQTQQKKSPKLQRLHSVFVIQVR